MKALIEKLLNRWRGLLGDEHERVHLQFVVVSAILAVVSFVMTVLNYVTDWYALMWSTLIFGVGSVINVILMLRRGILEEIAKVLFALEFMALFTFFVVVGEPEGFSALWVCMLPSCGVLLFKAKKGSMMVIAEFIILAFFFWTPFGQSLIYSGYTTSFLNRFPILYMAFFAIGLFFEFVRYTTQQELVKAKEKYEDLYNDESVRARREKQRNFEIIDVLASEYSSVYYLNLDTEDVEPYSMDEKTEEELGDILRGDTKYTIAYHEYVDTMVYEPDREGMIKDGSIEVIKEKLKSQKAYISTYRSITDEGPHYCELKFVKVGNIADEPKAVVVAFADRDQTIRHEQEHQRKLREAKIKAEAASNAKSVFLFNMSHDIRTPMNAIIGFTDIAMKHKNDPKKVEEYLTKVSVSSDHLLKLVNDVLDMAKIESGKVEIEETEANVQQCIDGILAMVKPSAKERKIKFTNKEHIDKHECVLVDVLRMNQVLLNVISNAIKYTDLGGEVDFITEKTEEKDGISFYKFVVKDNGIGMSKEFQKTIFESFTREKSSTLSGVQGTGLGMAITKRLLDMMNGNIEIESEQGVGTTVTITIGFKKVESKVIEAQEEAVSNEVSLSGKKILVVEDNMLNREIIKEILMDEGIEVEEAENGAIAVDMVKDKDPSYYDIILMDIQMPVMDGYGSTKGIRALTNADYSKVPIIAVTANAFDEDKQKAFDVGMNAHVAKPVNPVEIINVIKSFVK